MKRENEESLDYVDGCKYLDDVPFTGVGYYLDEEGRLDSEASYRDGIQFGLRRAWFETGTLLHEYPMFRGVLHGKKREWHRNGQLAEEADYEFGHGLHRKRWDEDGNLIEEYDIDKNSPAYKEVEEYREAYKDELDEIKRKAQELPE
jgi:antitoxin component YwqK of YwqJK toxin-antitoxin module